MYYIKTSPKVAKLLGHDSDRPVTADGNFLLWECDMDDVSHDLNDALTQTGSVAITPEEAKSEQRGKSSIPLNDPTNDIYGSKETSVSESGVSTDSSSSAKEATASDDTNTSTDNKESEATV
jgi:hypothetical protein